jgi:hypothetical protein
MGARARSGIWEQCGLRAALSTTRRHFRQASKIRALWLTRPNNWHVGVSGMSTAGVCGDSSMVAVAAWFASSFITEHVSESDADTDVSVLQAARQLYCRNQTPTLSIGSASSSTSFTNSGIRANGGGISSRVLPSEVAQPLYTQCLIRPRLCLIRPRACALIRPAPVLDPSSCLLDPPPRPPACA